MNVKIWTIKDGILGTHHKNRDGSWVDFRPSRGTRIDQDGNLVILPPKGQRVDPVEIIPTHKGCEVISRGDDGRKWVEYTLFGSFLGQEVACRGLRTLEWVSESKREEESRRLEESCENAVRLEREMEEFVRGLTVEQVANHRHSRRLYGRYLSGRRSVEDLVGAAINSLVIEEFGDEDLPWRLREKKIKALLEEGAEALIVEVQTRRADIRRESYMILSEE